MAYEMVMPYHLHMPSYFLETFTEYPYKKSLLPDHLFWDSETEKIADANHPLCSMFQALSSKASGCESV